MPISSEALIKLFIQAYDECWGYIWGKYGQTWTSKDQDKLEALMVSRYGEKWKDSDAAKDDDYYMGARYGRKWVGYRVADCSGLFRWAIELLGGKIAHGSNSIYDRYCSSKGKLTAENRKTLKPGTAVFVYKKETKKRTHIGLYIGDGVVIEAASTQKGVIKSKITDSKWTYWGELKMVDYSGENLGFPETPGWRPTIRRGSKGDEVTELQTMLWRLGYDLGPCGIDGDFGKATKAALEAFQKDHGLNPDGVCGPLSWDALDKAILGHTEPPKTYTVCLYHLNQTQVDTLKKEYPDAVVNEE